MQNGKVEVCVLSPGVHAERVRTHFESWFVADGRDLVFRSPLAPESSVSDQLKWFYNMLKFHRKLIRKLEADGIETIIRISIRGRSVVIEPESLLLAHQLHLKTLIEYRA